MRGKFLDGEPMDADAYFVTFGEADENDDAFESARFNGIIGRRSLLKVASSIDLGSEAAVGEEIHIPRAGDNTSGDRGEIAPAGAFSTGKSGANSKNPFGSDPGAAATMAVARLIAASGGKGLPQGLVRLMSPYQAHYDEMACLGKGGFGSVVSAVGRLDDRAVAVKKVHFKSAVPPWAKNDALEGLHEELLREARALALMENPNVVKYHTAWIEPRWSKLAAVGATTNRNGRRVGAGASKTALSPGALARRDSFIVADDRGSDSDYSDEYSEGASDYSESGSITGGGSARLLPGGGQDEKTGIGYSEVWTPAAVAGTLRWPYTLHIAMELCPSSTLRDWIRLRPRGEVQIGTASHIFRCVTEALRYVHAHGIIHRDIKPANVLVHRGVNVLEPTVKLMDFGLAVFYDFSAEKKPQERKKKGGATVAQVSLDGEDRSKGASENVFSVGVGTASYCAPEQRRGTGLYTSAVDMYSLGVILVEICTALGQEATESERLHLIADAKGLNMPEEMVAKFPKHARLAERLLAVDPKERPTADEVLKLWPRVNLRKGELPKTQMQFRSQHDRTQMGAAVAAAAAAGAAAAQSGTRAEVSSAAESAAVSAALDKLSIKRSMSLPEAELAAIADAVDAATNAVAGSGSPRRSPHKHRRAPSSLMSSLVLESDELVEESVGGGTSDESTSIDLETASRVDMAAEIRRLQERLAQLEGHAETT